MAAYLSNSIILTDPDILGGVPIFAGTRVPVEALWNNLEAGVSIDDFLDAFPSVTRKQVLAVLTFGKQAVIATFTQLELTVV